MKKIPTIFDRDWDGDRSRVLNLQHKDCAWVFAGEGVATRKIDGTCCLIRDGVLFKRRELRKGESAPSDFHLADFDNETGKLVGWVPVSDEPSDRWHREGFDRLQDRSDGTFELVGPKVQGNPEGRDYHELIRHGHNLAGEIDNVPRTFDGLRDWLSQHDVEGIVFHHPDGRMAKIKKRDFGLKRE